ncbi:MAG: hypothetical protein L0170_06335 [Acidobacteria bacterium]|nr:hypothetical protein [Acidobacteriota bacterium]
MGAWYSRLWHKPYTGAKPPEKPVDPKLAEKDRLRRAALQAEQFRRGVGGTILSNQLGVPDVPTVARATLLGGGGSAGQV